MGCNTSKDSAVPQERDSKENQNGGVENSEESDHKKRDTTENHVNNESNVKSASAKTVTLRSNGSAASPTAPDEKEEEEAEQPQPQQQAATKIQAAFRGHRTRQSMKQPAGGKAEAVAVGLPPAEQTREQLEEEFRTDDQELCHAATKIQASFRGHMSRKQENEKQHEESGSSQEKKADADEDLDIDLTDPDLNKAAVKIQASFRGHMIRKEHEGETQPNN